LEYAKVSAIGLSELRQPSSKMWNFFLADILTLISGFANIVFFFMPKIRLAWVNKRTLPLSAESHLQWAVLIEYSGTKAARN
jgi:hypothetical protein